jgi:diguanylate cyclase (GGDEF)-like protein/PAS domain S-box-containing protein
MHHDPKGTILVLSNADPSRLPVWKALQALEYETTALSVTEIASAADRSVHAVVLISQGIEGSEIEETVALIRETGTAPVLLVDDTLASQLSPVRDSDLGVTRIPGNLSGETLQWALSCALEFQSLHSQLARYRKLLGSAPIGVFQATDERITYVNDYMLQQLGYEQSELVGMAPIDIFVPEDRSRALHAIQTLHQRPDNAPPNIYRILAADHRVLVCEIRSRIISHANPFKVEGTIRDITQETHIEQLHRIVLELTEVILEEEDIDRILQLVLDTIVKHSGFRRALLSLYDLSIPDPFEGPVYKIMTSGLTTEERDAVLSQNPMDIEARKQVFSEEFVLGSAQYIPHDRTPWSNDVGITGTVSAEGWHPDDYLFIPLRGAGGIIGIISVDDPVEKGAPTLASIEPVALLARFAAIAVERVFKLSRLKKQAEQLHALSLLGRELAVTNDERSLCEVVTQRVCNDMRFDLCEVWLQDGMRLVLEAVTQSNVFAADEIRDKGTRIHTEGPGVIRLAFHTSEPVVIANTLADGRFNGTRETIRSFMSIPIHGRRGILGVITVASPRLAAFGEQDVELLSALASQLTTAIAGLRRRASLSRIYEFGQRLSVAATKEQAVTGTLEFMASQFDFHTSSILLMGGADILQIAGSNGPYEANIGLKKQIFQLSEGIVGHVASTQRFAIIPDVREDPRYIEESAETRSELAVPVLFSGSLLGVIDTESPTVGFFDDEDRRLVEAVATYLAIALSNIASQAKLREQAIRDPLTGLFNRHYFNSIIAAELSRSDRYAHTLSLMMVDVDGFRAVNNRMGHLTGDLVLQNVARMLTNGVRDSDQVIRYGGDEFLIIMPETNGLEDSQLIADRLRNAIASTLDGTDAEQIGLTLGLSIGIYSRSPGESKTLEEILEEVDRRMYADKRERNKDRADDYRY